MISQSLHSILSSYGDIIELDYQFDDSAVSEIIALNELNNKKGYGVTWMDAPGNKQALNLTGPLDDLQLDDQNDNTKHAFNQDYNDNLRRCSSIVSFFDKFHSLSRCRAVKLGAGSFFRPHRDAWKFNEQFRIFIPLNGTEDKDWMFFYENKSIKFKPGVPYILNTRKVHGSFCFSDDIYHILMSLPLTDKNLGIIMNMIPYYKDY
jgi:hypothetical protein